MRLGLLNAFVLFSELYSVCVQWFRPFIDTSIVMGKELFSSVKQHYSRERHVLKYP